MKKKILVSTPFIQIEDKKVGDQQPVYIIAEIGVNHDGSEEEAAELIRMAAAAGADAVKFQIVNSNESYTPGTPSFETFKSRVLTFDAYKRLKKLAEKLKIHFFATPGDLSSLDLLFRLKVPAIKLSSGLLTHTPLLQKAAQRGLPLLISTGGSYLWEAGRALYLANQAGAQEVLLFHCVSSYPSPAHALSLGAIQQMQNAFRIPIGYSDHYLEHTACIASVALGACAIERHITLDRKKSGADHHISSSPEDFGDLVKKIRECEQMIQGDVKIPQQEETQMRAHYRRCLVVNRDLKKGEALQEKDLGVKRVKTASSITPDFLAIFIDKKLVRSISENTPLDWSHITEVK